jgi:hypothetical protein
MVAFQVIKNEWYLKPTTHYRPAKIHSEKTSEKKYPKKHPKKTSEKNLVQAK